jgi:N-acetylmuramoyl-L-alanine amidase
MTGIGRRRPLDRRTAYGAVVLTLIAALAAPCALAAQKPSNDIIASGARVVGDANRTRFVADMSQNVGMAVFTMADPYRVIVDLPSVHFGMADGAGATGRGLVSAFRYGQIAPGKSRIVLDMTGPVEVTRSFFLPPVDGQPGRLVVDMVPTSRDKFLQVAALQRRSDPTAGVTPRSDRLDTKQTSGRIRIALDPGHGGIDAGAIGTNGTLEKTLVLAYAKTLADALRATGRYDVLMTREDDSFISLRKRVEFARAHDADLLISIHANSFTSGAEVKGATIYTLSENASDKVAAAVAASENKADILAGMDIPSDDSDQVTDILLDLTRRETKNFGIVFAKHMIDSLRARGITLTSDPRKEAAFMVLEAPDIPSALIELGYLSNKDDEAAMKTPAWQSRTADAMVRAIDGYFSTRLARDGGE